MRRICIVAVVLGVSVCASSTWAWTPVPGGRLNEVMVDDFEDGVLHELATNPLPDGFGWQKGTSAGQYTWMVDPAQGANGSGKSMRITCQTTVPYWWFLTSSRDPYILGGYDKPVNRMEYYIKFPQGWRRTAYTLPDPATYSYQNFNVGTYQRDPNQTLSTSTSTETYGWHFYYQIIFNMYDTDWVRVQLNQWPQHMRADHRDPGAYPCKPEGDLFSNWTRVYFTGTAYTDDAGVGYPYDIWFDQWGFYYENEYVAMSPEYGDRSATPGSAVSWPVTVSNTHPSETREFGLFLSSELFRGANYWTYNVHLYADPNGDGIHQANETSEPATTGTLQPGQKWRGVLVVTIPASGAGSEIGAYVRTALVAWQKSPAYGGLDPHISRARIKVGGVAQDNPDSVLQGTPCAGAQFFTRTVAAAAAADAIAPAAIDDLCLLAIGTNDAKFRWSAVGSDGRVGTAFAYQARYSTSPISEASWDTCTELTGEPDVYPAGTTQTWWMPPVLLPGTTYYLAIKVQDQAGNTSGLSNVVSFMTAVQQAGNAAPQAVAAADVTSGPTPLAVQFSSAGSSDADGSIALRVWDFGDGVVSNEASPAHTFNIVGTHAVTLTVFDNAGASHSAQVTVTTSRGPKGTILLRNGRDGYVGGWTTRIRTKDPNSTICGAYYGDPTVLLGMYAGTNRMLLQFPAVQTSLAIPAGSSIRQAKVSLYHAKNANQIDAEVYRLEQSHVPNKATWNSANTGVPWATPGAIPAGATPLGTFGLDRHALMWRPFDVTGWAKTAAEMGIAIKLVQEPTDTSPQVYFGTHDDPMVEHRPALVVDYTLTGDLNDDGSVDVVDLLTFVDTFGKIDGDPGYDPLADLNDDASVDVVDLLIFVDNFGRSAN